VHRAALVLVAAFLSGDMERIADALDTPIERVASGTAPLPAR
jgi:hypothetical protein